MECKSLNLTSILASANLFWQPPPPMPYHGQQTHIYGQYIKSHVQMISDKINIASLPHGLKRLINSGIQLMHHVQIDAYEFMRSNFTNGAFRNRYELFPAVFTNPVNTFYIHRFVTNDGRFDEKSWIRKFVRDEHYDPYDRFIAGCLFCLEDDIRVILDKFRDLNIDTDEPIVNFWIIKLRANDVDLWFNGFLIAVEADQVTAAEYFWQKMSSAKKNEFLMDFHLISNRISYAANTDKYRMVAFLMSILHKQQRSDVLMRDFNEIICYSPILWSFTQPRCDSWQIVRLINNFSWIPSGVLTSVFVDVALALKNFGCCVYREIFRELWERGNMISERLVCVLMDGEEWDLVRMVLRDAKPEWKFKFLDTTYVGVFYGDTGDIENVEMRLRTFVSDGCGYSEDTFQFLKVFEEKIWGYGEPYESVFWEVLENLRVEVTDFYFKEMDRRME